MLGLDVEFDLQIYQFASEFSNETQRKKQTITSFVNRYGYKYTWVINKISFSKYKCSLPEPLQFCSARPSLLSCYYESMKFSNTMIRWKFLCIVWPFLDYLYE